MRMTHFTVPGGRKLGAELWQARSDPGSRCLPRPAPVLALHGSLLELH